MELESGDRGLGRVDCPVCLDADLDRLHRQQEDVLPVTLEAVVHGGSYPTGCGEDVADVRHAVERLHLPGLDEVGVPVVAGQDDRHTFAGMLSGRLQPDVFQDEVARVSVEPADFEDRSRSRRWAIAPTRHVVVRQLGTISDGGDTGGTHVADYQMSLLTLADDHRTFLPVLVLAQRILTEVVRPVVHGVRPEVDRNRELLGVVGGHACRDDARIWSHLGHGDVVVGVAGRQDDGQENHDCVTHRSYSGWGSGAAFFSNYSIICTYLSSSLDLDNKPFYPLCILRIDARLLNMDTELLNYISTQLSEGAPPEVIRVNLHMLGKWTEEEIVQAMQSSITPTQISSVPVQQITPPQQPVIENTSTVLQDTNSNRMGKSFKIVISTLVVLLVLGGAYFVWGSGLMVGGMYEEDNILSGMIAKYANIHSSTYTASMSIKMVEREKDARPLPSEKVVADNYSSDFISFLPRELELSGFFSMSADWQNKDLADWKFNVGGSGDLGDLKYKINIDGIQKDGEMYIKINNINIPMIPFLGGMSVLKGQWIKVGNSSSSPQELFGFSDYSSSEKKTYKETHDEVVDFLTRAAALSDENHLLKISGSKNVEIDGRNLTRYDVTLRKDSLLPIYEKLKKDYEFSTNTSIATYFKGDTYEYLASQRFSDVFDYWEKNAELVLYVDQDGNPAIVEYKTRIIPSDSATQLSDRQVNAVFKLIISNINKRVDIEAPKDAKSFEDAISGTPLGASLSSARSKGNDVKTKANLSGLRSGAEIYYDNNNGYGISTNSCFSGMFADTISGISSYVDIINYPEGTKLSCHSNGTNYAVSASLTDGYFCVDSRGKAKTETSPLATGQTSCQ